MGACIQASRQFASGRPRIGTVLLWLTVVSCTFKILLNDFRSLSTAQTQSVVCHLQIRVHEET